MCFDMRIDKKSGKFRNEHLDLHKKKFATYPYIGSKYGNSGNTEKILFVGLDIGKGRWEGGIQTFSERRRGIEDTDFCLHNPHIAGTYMAALYFLKDKFGWNAQWKKILSTRLTCQKVLRSDQKELLPSKDPLQYSKNPLSYCALTNYYKFMTEGVKKMRAPENREWLCQDKEKRLFLNEVDIFDPDIVIFQGKGFLKAAKDLKSEGKVREIYVGYHPAAPGSARKPKKLINSILKGKQRK